MSSCERILKLILQEVTHRIRSIMSAVTSEYPDDLPAIVLSM
jgi:hypothetical protein